MNKELYIKQERIHNDIPINMDIGMGRCGYEYTKRSGNSIEFSCQIIHV